MGVEFDLHMVHNLSTQQNCTMLQYISKQQFTGLEKKLTEKCELNKTNVLVCYIAYSKRVCFAEGQNQNILLFLSISTKLKQKFRKAYVINVRI